VLCHPVLDAEKLNRKRGTENTTNGPFGHIYPVLEQHDHRGGRMQSKKCRTYRSLFSPQSLDAAPSGDPDCFIEAGLPRYFHEGQPNILRLKRMNRMNSYFTFQRSSGRKFVLAI
jgi:hypothetical protein